VGNREGGKEKQCRMLCIKCSLPIAYMSDAKKGDKTYLLEGGYLKEDELPDVQALQVQLAAASRMVGPIAPGTGLMSAMSGGGRAAPRAAGSSKGGQSVGVETSAKDEAMMNEKREMSANFDANAQVIEKVLGKSRQTRMREEIEATVAEQKRKKARGTLLN
jgi:hypothetical protein